MESSPSSHKNVAEPAVEGKVESLSSAERAYEIILQDDRVSILINGTGNILNEQAGATKGQTSAWYNNSSKKLVRLRDLEVDQCLDSRTPELKAKYQLRTDTLKGGQVLVLDIAVRGQTGNAFLEDNRKGCHLTCGLRFSNETELREVLGQELSSELFSGNQLLTQRTGELLNLFLKRLIPEYYQTIAAK